MAHVEQREAADLVAAHEAEEARLATGDILLRPSVTERLRVGGETWVDTLRRQERHGLGTGQDTWRDAAFALASALDDQTARSARLEGELYRMSLDELVALRGRARNCVGLFIRDEQPARLPEDLPDDIAQEAGQFYEQDALARPGLRKAEAMRHAWREVIRPRVGRLESAS